MYALRTYVLLPSLVALSACSAAPVLSEVDQVTFSHSDPASVAAPVRDNTWSASQWPEMAAEGQANPEQVIAKTSQDMVVYFETDADQLAQSELDRLSQFLNQIKSAQGHKMVLVGHTDSRFTSSYNQSLSERRATKVSELLVAHGVDQRSITVKARGQQEPAASNESEMGRAKNRRVTLYVAE